MDIAERFLKYVSYDTTSYEGKGDRENASSLKELILSKELAKELKDLGGSNVRINQSGTVYAYFPGKGKTDADPVALIAHIDTSSSAHGDGIKPRIIKNYDGKDIVLSKDTVMKAKDFPLLSESVGHDLIVTDGTTLLGGDDKAGVAIIMEAVNYLSRTGANHGPFEIVFSTDEEIGLGAEHIDVEELLSPYGYTLDGGGIRYINVENFNAASMKITVTGRSIHPGSAKDKMINALNVGIDFHMSLPRFMRPEDTEEREGFYHLLYLSGTEDKAELMYIIRDHDMACLDHMIDYARLAAARINDRYETKPIDIEIIKTYKNMKPEIDKHPEVTKRIEDIFNEMGLEFEYEPIRGGTDGASLTFKGFPCPNLGTGDYNCHGRFEYVDINQMKTMTEVVKKIVA